MAKNIPTILPKGEFMGIGSLSPDPKWYLKSQSHPHHELILVVRGRMTARTPEGEVTGESGDILFYREQLPHEEFSDSSKPVESLFFSFRHDFGTHPPPLKFKDSAGRIRQLMQWLLEERSNTTNLGRKLRESFFTAILAELYRLNSPHQSKIVSETHAFIEAHLDEGIDLSTLASLFKMNPSAYLRKYKAQTGQTPMEAVRVIRAERARDYLLSTNLPLKHIAPKVGFANEYHLSRILKKHFDTTPGQIRKNHTYSGLKN